MRQTMSDFRLRTSLSCPSRCVCLRFTSVLVLTSVPGAFKSRCSVEGKG